MDLASGFDALYQELARMEKTLDPIGKDEKPHPYKLEPVIVPKMESKQTAPSLNGAPLQMNNNPPSKVAPKAVPSPPQPVQSAVPQPIPVNVQRAPVVQMRKRETQTADSGAAPSP